MDSWANGAKGSDVKSVIDKNFDVLDKRTKKINEDISNLSLSNIVRNFIASDWVFNNDLKTYTFSIPYVDYNKESPCVDAYIKDGNGYSFVYGGCIIGEQGIILQSDIPYEGKVVIR